MSTANNATATNDLPSGDEVDQLHPWLGLASFSEDTRSFFYGREEEVGELSRRVQRKLLTVLFGQSGLGKTSILRAGIVPRLRGQGYCPVYVRIDYGPQAPSAQEQIKQAILRETATSGTWTHSGSAAADESLWEFLHHRDDVLLDPQGKPLIPLLIFDQFEEIFTLAQGDDDGRLRASNFLSGLAELVENRPSKELEAKLEEDDSAIDRFDFARNDYRVLITLREDYLPHLESLKAAMPSITQNRLRLAPMTGTQALAAVTGPGGKLVTQEVAEAIVRFVAGGAELAHAQVEPSLLSLICRELNDKRIAANRKEISLDLLAGSHASILTDFYERALVDQPQAVRNVIEDVLLTDSGYRENVAEERVLSSLTNAGALPDASTVLALLVNRRLLRIEDRLDIRRVELTHDVLCSVVKESRSQRHERETLARNERKLEEQEARERTTRKSLVRARQIIAGATALSVVAVASAVFGYVSMRRAQDTQAQADSARNGAETLVSYLMDDFNTELAPIGRLDLVGELAKRTVDYYNNLPPGLSNTATQANHARALIRLGQVLGNEGKLEQAAKTVDQAIALLEPIVANSNVTETNQLSLANAVTFRGLVYYASGDRVSAKTMYERSVALVAPLALSPKASAAARLEYARSRTNVGFYTIRKGDYSSGAIELNAARRVISDATERENNIPMMMVYLQAGQWLQETMGRGAVKDYKGAEVLAQELIDGTNEVLQKRPNHRDALRVRAGVKFMRAFFAFDQGQAGMALSVFNTGVDTYEEARRTDPTRIAPINSLAIHLGFQARALIELGRSKEAKLASERIWTLYESIPSSNDQAYNLYGFSIAIAEVYAELDETQALTAMRRRIHTYGEMFLVGKEASLAQGLALTYKTDELALATITGESSVTADALAAARLRGEQLLAKSKTEENKRDILNSLSKLQRLQARFAYTKGDYAQALESSNQALASVLQTNQTALGIATYRIEYALALARLKQLPEASKLIQEVLDVQRSMIANGADSQTLRLELAQSLYVSALTQPKAGGKELAEAATLIAKLPSEMQDYRTVKLWRSRINDEIRLNTRAALGVGATADSP